MWQRKWRKGMPLNYIFGASKRDHVIIKPPTPSSVSSFSGGRVCTGVHVCSGALHRPSKHSYQRLPRKFTAPDSRAAHRPPPPPLCIEVEVSVTQLSLPHLGCLPLPTSLFPRASRRLPVCRAPSSYLRKCANERGREGGDTGGRLFFLFCVKMGGGVRA